MKNLSFLHGFIAHRGLHGDFPENSICAFKKAIDEGIPIELDVHLLADNSIVVFHDDNLYRMCGVNKKINKTTYNEIKSYTLLNSNCSIPLFSEVLGLVNGKVPLIIELKYDRFAGLLERKIVKYLDKYNGEFCVKSFNPLSVLWFRIFRSNYKRGYLISDRCKCLKDKFLKSKFCLLLCKPDFLSVNYKLYNDKKVIKFKKNKPVVAWTINSKKKLDKYRDKFDGLIIEDIKKSKSL